MKNRFAMLAVLGAILCSVFIAGCSGGGDTDNATTNNATSTNAASKDTADQS